jgi:hypothetical protein
MCFCFLRRGRSIAINTEMVHNMQLMKRQELELPTFDQLPAEGVAQFRPPFKEGSLRVDDEHVDKTTHLEPIAFTVSTVVENEQAVRYVTLARKPADNEPADACKPLQIYHADPELPGEYSGLQHMLNVSPRAYARWLGLLESSGQNTYYPPAARLALQRPVTELRLRQRAGEELWAVTGEARVRNPHAAFRFLNIAGSVAVGKMAAQAAAAAKQNTTSSP